MEAAVNVEGFNDGPLYNCKVTVDEIDDINNKQISLLIDLDAIPVKFSEKYKGCHYFYCKVHSTRNNDRPTPKDRTLFVVGVPPYCSEETIVKLFTPCGMVDRVILLAKPTAHPEKEETSKFFPKEHQRATYRVAYVIFKNSKGLKRAVTLSLQSPFVLSTQENIIKTGLEKWCNEYVASQSVNKTELQTDVDRFMKKYDARVEREARLERKNDGEPDEDGWITVTRTGKYKGVPRTEAEEERTKAKEKKKRKEKELLNFYTFQIRESKRERIAELRRKFEEDKQKITQLKLSRRFRPF